MVRPSVLFALVGTLEHQTHASPVADRRLRRDCSSRPTLNFTSCAADSGFGTAFECGTLKVPIDHDRPIGANNTLDLWVSRRKANGTGTGGSLGTLFFNQGGPGAVTSHAWMQLAMGLPLFSQAILENYDIIAVDPRGLGKSTPLQCDPELWNSAPPAMVKSQTEFDALVDFNKKFAASCEERSGPLFNFLDTVSTVKDYELMRQALGVDKINYLGFSYGTLQGQAYAELFPEHVGRFVLDALVDHKTGGITALMAESATYEATLQQFFTWCSETTDCAGADLPRIFANLTSTTEIPAPSCNDGTCRPTVRGEDILFSTQSALLFVDSLLGHWTELASNLQSAMKGDAQNFSRALFGPSTPAADTSGSYIGFATACQDLGSWASSYTDMKRVLDVASHQSPLTKGASQTMSLLAYCAGWTAPVRYPPRALDPVQIAKLPPVLMVNAFYDPSTSPVWAEAVREQVPNSSLIWRDGAGHTSYLLYGETSSAIDDFLLTGKMPADGTIYSS